MKRLLLFMLSLVAAISYVSADTISEDFSGNALGLPTTSTTTEAPYTSSSTGLTYTFGGGYYYYSSGKALFLSKSAGYFSVTVGDAVKSITVKSGSSGSKSAKLTVTADGTSIGSLSLTTQGSDFSIDVPTTSQAAGTTFKFSVANSNNVQIASITFTTVDDSGSGDTGSGDSGSGESGGDEGDSGDTTVTKWEKVTSTSQLVTGKQYILAYENTVIGAYNSNKYYAALANTLSIATDGSATTASADVNPFTLVSGTADDTYAFQFGSSYTSCTGTANASLKEVTALGATCNVSISITDGTATIIFTENSNSNQNKFQYNSANPRFTNYKTGAQKDPTIYRLVEDVDDSGSGEGGGSGEVTKEDLGDALAWSAATASVTLGEESPTLPVLTNSKGVSISYSSSKPEVATIAEDGTVSILAAGETTISAIFAGDDSYNAATVSYTLTVTEPVINEPTDLAAGEFAWNTDAVLLYGDLTTNNFPVLTNSNSVTVSYTSSDTNVAEIAEDGTLTLKADGTTVISAVFAGNDNFNAATVSYTATVIAQKVNTVWQKVTSTDQIALGKEYIIASGTTALGPRTSDEYKIYEHVTNGITLSDTGEYATVGDATVRSFLLVDGATEGFYTFKDGAFFIGATAKTTLNKSYAPSTNTDITISLTDKGLAQILFNGISTSSTSYYLQYNSTAYRFTCYAGTMTNPTLYVKVAGIEAVDLSDEEFGWTSTEAVEVVLDKDYSVLPTLRNTKSLAVSYASSDTDVAEIAEEGTVTIKATGSTVISASFAGTADYNAKTSAYTLTVTPNPNTLPEPPAESALWDIVISTEELVDGDIVTFITDSYTSSTGNVTYPPLVMSAAGSGLISAAESTLLDGVFTDTTQPYYMQLISKDGKWVLKAPNGLYIAPAKSGIGVQWVDGEPTDDCLLTISFGSNEKAIVTAEKSGNSYNTLRYNPNISGDTYNVGSARFAFYNTGQQDVHLYKVVDVIRHDTPDIIAVTDLIADYGDSFENSAEIAIGADDDATIHYTIDGTEPTSESTVYTDSFTITETTTVKAIAIKDGVVSRTASLTVTKLDVVTPFAPKFDITSDLKIDLDAATEFPFHELILVGLQESGDADVSVYYTLNSNAPKLGEDGTMSGTLWDHDPNWIELTETTNLRAVALRKGVVSSTTTIKLSKVSVTDPVINMSDANGDKASIYSEFTITVGEADDMVFYTLDGTSPLNEESTYVEYSSTAIPYENGIDQIALEWSEGETTITVNVVAINVFGEEGHTVAVASNIVSKTYTLVDTESSTVVIYGAVSNHSGIETYGSTSSSQSHAYVLTATDGNDVVHAMGLNHSGSSGSYNVKAVDANLIDGVIYLQADYTAHNHAEFILEESTTAGKYTLWRQLKGQDKQYLFHDSKGLQIAAVSADELAKAEFTITYTLPTTDSDAEADADADTQQSQIHTLAARTVDTDNCYIVFADDTVLAYNSTATLFNAYSASTLTASNYYPVQLYISDDNMIPTGVDTIAVDSSDAEEEYFNLQGVRIANPGAGLYIRRQGNAVSKIVIK